MNDANSQILAAPIVPLKGAATVNLGETKESVLRKLGTPEQILTGDVVTLEYRCFAIHLEGGSVFEVTVLPGYRGTTEEGAWPGMSCSELIRKYDDIEFSEQFYAWFSKSRIGMTFEIFDRPGGVREFAKVKDDRTACNGLCMYELPGDLERAFVGSISVNAFVWNHRK